MHAYTFHIYLLLQYGHFCPSYFDLHQRRNEPNLPLQLAHKAFISLCVLKFIVMKETSLAVCGISQELWHVLTSTICTAFLLCNWAMLSKLHNIMALWNLFWILKLLCVRVFFLFIFVWFLVTMYLLGPYLFFVYWHVQYIICI